MLSPIRAVRYRAALIRCDSRLDWTARTAILVRSIDRSGPVTFEYKVIPAPSKGDKTKGLRSAEDRFANALERQVNEMAAEGWEYVRCDTLPSEERAGLTQSQTVWRNLLVFRREKAAEAPRLLEAPVLAQGDKPKLRAVETLPPVAPAEEDEPPRSRAEAALRALPGPLRARALRLRAVGESLR